MCESRISQVLFILFAASAFRKLSSIYVFSYFPFGFEGGIWDLIVLVPDHCLSFYITRTSIVSMGESLVSQRQIPCLWVVLYIIGTLIGCMQDS